jgi:hypothetical protein
MATNQEQIFAIFDKLLKDVSLQSTIKDELREIYTISKLIHEKPCKIQDTFFDVIKQKWGNIALNLHQASHHHRHEIANLTNLSSKGIDEALISYAWILSKARKNALKLLQTQLKQVHDKCLEKHNKLHADKNEKSTGPNHQQPDLLEIKLESLLATKENCNNTNDMPNQDGANSASSDEYIPSNEFTEQDSNGSSQFTDSEFSDEKLPDKQSCWLSSVILNICNMIYWGIAAICNLIIGFCKWIMQINDEENADKVEMKMNI